MKLIQQNSTKLKFKNITWNYNFSNHMKNHFLEPCPYSIILFETSCNTITIKNKQNISKICA